MNSATITIKVLTDQEVRFTVKPAAKRHSCNGCMFDKQTSSVCVLAADAAISNGLPDCDDAPGYIYVADDSDPRQMTLADQVPE
jgi:hypothetical protein